VSYFTLARNNAALWIPHAGRKFADCERQLCKEEALLRADTAIVIAPAPRLIFSATERRGLFERFLY
jgi:hypothetical protein